MNDTLTSVAYYRVKPGKVEAFLDVIDRHAAAMRDLDLITSREVEVFVGEERETNGPLVVEIFDWADETASGRAHTHPRVSEVWEAMGPLCEPRAGRPPFEFANLRRLEHG
jgi:quinol monooxygenase YgiN